MCLPAEPRIWRQLTQRERLSEMQAVREHHRQLLLDFYSLKPGAAEAYDDHVAEHRAAAERLKAERTK